MVDLIKYYQNRKNGLRELLKLAAERERISKRMGRIRKELDAWDRAMLEE